MTKSRFLLGLSFTTFVLVCAGVAQEPAARGAARPKPEPAKPAPTQPVLGEAATRTLVHSFTSADHWAMKAVALLSLGRDWHPAGAEAVLAALQDKDMRLRAFGIESLRRTEAKALAAIAIPELVQELVDNQLKHKNPFVQERVLEVLKKMLPSVVATDRAGWQNWWREARKEYQPAVWQAQEEQGRGRGTAVGTLVERAFDLRDAGLDLAIVIDSTGSMQRAIDAARDAVDEVVALLAGIAPKLRLGLVHYKDFGDFSGGAQLLVPMTRNQKQVKDRLARLVASGGGDIPERVEKGIELALSREMAWDRNANRLILVIGDAPPHADTHAALKEMVRKAHEEPFAGRGPTTGRNKTKLRPFITSTIATPQQAKTWFDEIAEAGGGTSVLLPIDAAGQSAGDAVQRVVEHILVLSFGAQYQPQMKVFADTFFEYRAAGAL